MINVKIIDDYDFSCVAIARFKDEESIKEAQAAVDRYRDNEGSYEDGLNTAYEIVESYVDELIILSTGMDEITI